MLRLDHLVINARDIDSLLRFYCDILQLAAERLDAYRAGTVPFPSLRLNRDTVIDLFPPALWQERGEEEICLPNLNHFCLAMDRAHWQELQVRLIAHGISIDTGPVQRWGAHGTGVSIYIRDPEANVVELRYYDSAANDRDCRLGS